MSEDGTAAPAPPQTARKGFLARVVGVFFSPGETFEDIGRKPTILMPLLLLMVLQGVAAYVLAPVQGQDAARFTENSRFMQRLPEEQRAQIIEQQRNPSPARRIGSGVIAPVMIVVVLAISALVFWGMGNLLGGEPTFKKTFSMLLFAGFLFLTANTYVKMPLMIAKNTQAGVTFSPAMFMPDLEVTSRMYRLLSIFDAFALWGVVVIGIGIAKVAKISTGKGIVTSAVFYGLLATLGYILAGLFL